MSDNLDFTVSHKGTRFELSLSPESTLSALGTRLEELTSVPIDNQKLLYKGKKASVRGGGTLLEAGLKSGLKVQLLGPTQKELDDMKGVEDEKRRVDQILRERAAKSQAKLRSTGPSTSSPDPKYRFHQIEPLAHLPNPSSARQVLTRLANDSAILHVMRTHKFAVGLLTELAPLEHPNLLGLNTNAGQEIKLRIRTDAYDGFRPYADIRRVLCHELTHNVWSEHDNNFKELNSQLNREVAQYERSVAQGTHRLGGASDEIYEPSSQLEGEAHEYLLGGGPDVLGGISPSSSGVESVEERRRRILEATMSRLKKEEEELERSCGSAGPSATH